MYAPGQIIYDLDKRKPFKMGNVWDRESYPKRHVHFLKSSNKLTGQRAPGGLFYELYEIAEPKSIAEAKRLLKENFIAPAPFSKDYYERWIKK